jgi:hypothetical protein
MEYPNKRSAVDITLDSVHFIDQVINGDIFEKDSVEEKKNHVKRNVEHLQIVKGGSYVDLTTFSASDLAAIDEAISVGNTYISSL